MPLERGKSQDVIGRNIQEMLHSYHATGKIGNITPKSHEHALEIAKAAAERQARVSWRRSA